MVRQQLIGIYLDWRNNYLTIEKFAERNDLQVDQARALIDLARAVFDSPHPEG